MPLGSLKKFKLHHWGTDLSIKEGIHQRIGEFEEGEETASNGAN